MLFNSYEFIFCFLPLTLLFYFGLAKFGRSWAALAMVSAGFFFYAWWRLDDLYLLLISMSVNYFIAKGIQRNSRRRSGISKAFVIFGVLFNLGFLGVYKYTHFFIENLNHFLSLPISPVNITLPLGISFFTFTQLAYLVDLYQQKAKPFGILQYSMFVTYFPHLIAGPILHHREMAPQFNSDRAYQFSWDGFALGLTIFTLGLFKKVGVADLLSPFVIEVFDKGRTNLGFSESWLAVIGYTLQIYFDFSGYSDMAVGLAKMFSVDIPFNFESPYKATSIIDFWRRWHITLSRFLRDYLYIPLGGNKMGMPRRYLNLMVTMVLGGFWHGASWNFVIWGGLHGVFLLLNHFWRARQMWFRLGLSQGATAFGGVITFFSVMFAWIFFRAAELSTVWNILVGLLGGNGAKLSRVTDSAGITHMAVVVLALGLTFFFPNVRKWSEAKWRPTWRMAILTALLLAACWIKMRVLSNTEFIYFNF